MKKLTWILLVLVFTGCATERIMTMGGKTYPPTSAADVKIYNTKTPTGDYEEIGRVSVDKYNNVAMSRSGDAINKLLREKAASIGGDAIIGITEDLGSMSGVVIKMK